MSSGAFTPTDRAIIYARSDGRCCGCGASSPLTAQHRRARGMGGTSSKATGQHPNGVALCGSGTTGCHGWTEHHPYAAELLGWRLSYGDDPLEAPYFDRLYGWRMIEPDGGHRYVDDSELDRHEERLAALDAYRAHLKARAA